MRGFIYKVKNNEFEVVSRLCLLCPVAVCCSVLQCVAVCCSVLQCAAVSSRTSSSESVVSICCSVLQCVAMCCSVLQCVAVSSRTSSSESCLYTCILKEPTNHSHPICKTTD